MGCVDPMNVLMSLLVNTLALDMVIRSPFSLELFPFSFSLLGLGYLRR
jgi:hypothetical protein